MSQVQIPQSNSDPNFINEILNERESGNDNDTQKNHNFSQDIIRKKIAIAFLFLIVYVIGVMCIAFSFSLYLQTNFLDDKMDIESSNDILSTDDEEISTIDIATTVPTLSPTKIESYSPTYGISSMILTNNPSAGGSQTSLPTFKPDPLWDYSNIAWIYPEYNLAKIDGSTPKIISIAPKEDTNPEITLDSTDGDHFIEIAFKANSLSRYSNENPLISQLGLQNGWGISVSKHVELIWSTSFGDDYKESNEFSNKKVDININEWTHVVGAYVWSRTKLTLYVNGIPSRPRYVFGNFEANEDYRAIIGGSNLFSSVFFDGSIAFAHIRQTLPVNYREMDEYVMELSKKRLKILNEIDP